MRHLLIFLVLAISGVLSSSLPSPPSLAARTADYCGADGYGVKWYCNETAECCVGTVYGTCMPVGSTCCDTGYYCAADEDCWIDAVESTQYCIPAGSSGGANATKTAEATPAGQTSTSSSNSSSTKGEASKVSDIGLAMKTLALLPVLAAIMVWL